MIVKPEDITLDVLDEVAEEWEQDRLYQLARDEVIQLGHEYARARIAENRLEMQCMIRARKMRMLGFDKREVAQLFGVPVRVVNKWMKGMN